MSKKLSSQLALALSILSWLALLLVELMNQFSATNNLDSGFFNGFTSLLFFFYTLSLFWFYLVRVDDADRHNLIALLWKIFVTGMFTTLVSFAIKSLDIIFEGTKLMKNPLVVDFLFLIIVGLLSAFLMGTFVVWKRLILYQKTKKTLMLWAIFEYALFGSIFLDFFTIPYEEYFFVVIILLGLLVSANMKWVAYLSFKQKWKSILLLAITLLYIVYFYLNLNTYRNNYEFLTFLSNSVFIQSAFFFTGSYSVFSLLVIVFNLPTTSAFEQKLNEVVNFQRLSQSIQTEKNEDQVYEILLDSAVRTTEADAAWIEVKSSEVFFFHNISFENTVRVKTNFYKPKLGSSADVNIADRKNTGYATSLKKDEYKSIAIFPICVNEIEEGKIYLLKEVRDGFTDELIDITRTFANQAGISIANFKMLEQALTTERYKEELKIAKQVQTKLLPLVLDTNHDFEASTFTAAADEVGGDYYDSFKISGTKTAIIIGDVSGKGTSAAFHMAQMKGVFLALGQLNLPPAEFLVKANLAISSGLDKSSFVTISYFVINSENKSIEFARAGHAPSLYFNKIEKKACYFKNKGLGLGIIRDDSYKNFIQPSSFNYSTDDVLVLYTDGITEAKNIENDEYGYDRLLEMVEEHADKSAVLIQEKIIEDLYCFCKIELLQDDYSLVVIKFS